MTASMLTHGIAWNQLQFGAQAWPKAATGADLGIHKIGATPEREASW